MSNTIPVNEIFEGVYGKATFAGTPSVFVRVQGCHVGCPWCDAKHAWDELPEKQIPAAIMFMKTESDSTYARFSVADLIECLGQFEARHVVITGGEPCMYDLREHTKAICDSGRTCQIETSGTSSILADDRCFVTLSPKFGMPGGLTVLDAAFARADEIEYLLGKESDLKKIGTYLIDKMPIKKPFWLHRVS